MNLTKQARLDRFRVLCAVLVIAIHTSPLASVSADADWFLTRVIARVAVPFFFLSTGYFSRDKLEQGGIGKSLRKLTMLYLAAVALYLPLNLYTGSLHNITPVALLRNLALDGTFYHLWYFPAVILGLVLLRFGVKLLGWKGAGALAFLLYLIGLGGDSWFGLAIRVPGLDKFYSTLFSAMDYTRNGLFFAPVYLWAGAWLTRHPMDRGTGAVGLLLSGCAMVAEAALLHHGSFCRFDSMYLSLLPVSLCLFALLAAEDRGGRKDLRVFSLLVYVVHPWCIVALRAIARPLGLWGLLVENSVTAFVFVCLLSGAVSAVGTALWSKLRRQKDAPPEIPARAWVELDEDALLHNAAVLQSKLSKGCRLMAVVKANAYGHGAETVAHILERAGVSAFAVATLGEAVQLRQSGIAGDILILGYTPPVETGTLFRYGLIQTVADLPHALALDAAGVPVRVHIALDTGMHRLGVPWNDPDALEQVYACQNLRVEGLFSHLCTADSEEAEDILFTKAQIQAFFDAGDTLKARGHYVGELHLQASAGIFRCPDLPCDYARAGIALYGLVSRGEPDGTLRPVLSLRARIATVRTVETGECAGYGRDFTAQSPRRIAAVTIGYADGIPNCYARHGGQALVRGQRADIVGRVCMDQLLLDVTDIPNAAQGDVVTFIGTDEGESITAGEMAEKCRVITNELVSRLCPRIS